MKSNVANIRRLHPALKLTRTISGRLATSGFPVLGMPHHSEEGRQFRRLLRAPRGFVIYEADYSQIELRAAGELSHDEKLIEAYKRGEDIHAKTAHLVLNAPKDKAKQDDHKHRLPAKTGNFSMLMGTTPMGLTASIHKAGNLEWSADCPGCKSYKAPHVKCDSERFMREWFTTYSGVRAWMDERRAYAEQTGTAYGMWGMSWALPGAFSPHEEVREQTLRQAHALPVQEGAQRLIKKAMAAVWAKDLADARKLGMPVEPILQIHDSLLFVVERAAVRIWHAMVKATMENIVTWSLPIVAEGKVGENWLEQEKLK